MKKLIPILFILALNAGVANAQLLFFPIPIPNTEKPPQLKQLIEALEKSSDTKAVATAAEDKTFGTRNWIWGYISGEMTQEEADRFAMASCTASLDQLKSQSAGGKPIYNFGKKKCELFKFTNKSVRMPTDGKIKVTSSDGTFQKFNLITKFESFKARDGWGVNQVTPQQKNIGFALISVNSQLDLGMKVEVGAKTSSQDFRGYVESIRNTRRNIDTIDNVNLSSTKQMTVNDRLSYQYTFSGRLKENKNFEITYEDTVIDLGDAALLLTFWSSKSTYDSSKPMFENLAKQLVSFATGDEEQKPENIVNIPDANGKRVSIELDKSWSDLPMPDQMKTVGFVKYSGSTQLNAGFTMQSTATSGILDFDTYVETTLRSLESVMKDPERGTISFREINGIQVAQYEVSGVQNVLGNDMRMKYLSTIVVDERETFVIRFNTLNHSYDITKKHFDQNLDTLSVASPQRKFSAKQVKTGAISASELKDKCIKLGFKDGSDDHAQCMLEILKRTK